MNSETLAKKEKVREIAWGIAASMPNPKEWSVNPPDEDNWSSCHELIGPKLNGHNLSTMVLNVDYDTYCHKNRVVISGGCMRAPGKYPTLTTYLGYRESMPSITVSPDKTYAAMVKDIEKRLMPNYKKALAKMVAGHCEAVRRDTEANRDLNTLMAAMVNGRLARHSDALMPTDCWGDDMEAKCYGGTVTLEINHLTVDAAVRIIKAANWELAKVRNATRKIYSIEGKE